MADVLPLAISSGVFCALCWVFRTRLTDFTLGSAIVLIPIGHVSFMPQALFGIPGISLTNFVFLTAAACVLREAGLGNAFRNLPRYFTPAVVVFGILFIVAVLRTAADVDSLLLRENVERPTPFRVLVLEGLLSAKFVALGFLVALRGIQRGSLATAEKSLLVLTIVLFPIIVTFYVMGVTAPPNGELLYDMGRDSIADNFGVHTNYLGRMAVYLLLFAVVSTNLAWKPLRCAAIFCAIALIEVSFSRTSWIAGTLLLLFALRRNSTADRLLVAASIAVVSLALLPQLAERSEYGLEGTSEPEVAQTEVPDDVPSIPVPAAEPAPEPAFELDPQEVTETLHRVAAGRTSNIWPSVMPIFYAHPIFGQGLFSVFRPVDPEAKRIAYNHPHNAYLEVALDMGVVGLAVVAWMMWGFWRLGRFYPPFRYLVAGWLLVSMTGGSFYPQLQNALNWIVLGMAVAARENSGSRPNSS